MHKIWSVLLPVALVFALVPAAASPARAATLVTCGFPVTESIVLANSLINCPLSGLVVNAQDVVIDLNGFTIDGDSDDDVVGFNEFGIDNSQAHNGVVIRDGMISGFEAGIFIEDPASRNRVQRVRTQHNTFAGFDFAGSEHVFKNNAALDEDSGGFNFSGTDHLLRSNTAAAPDPFEFTGISHTLIGNKAFASSAGFNGYDFAGSGHTLTRNLATGGDFNGFNFSGDGHTFKRNRATGNESNGFNPSSSDNCIFVENVARGNGGTGFRIAGDSHIVKRNTSLDNGRIGFQLFDDSGNTLIENKANRNGFTNGEEDDLGLGIDIDPGATSLVAKRNTAKGNDHPDQCTPNAGCN